MRSRLGLLVAMALALVALIGLSPSAAQFPRLPSGLRDLTERIPDLDQFLTPGPVLTSGMADAVGRMGPLPNGLTDGRFESLTALPRGPKGEFLLRAGRFSTVVQSFCLKAGAHARNGGEGFLAAPLMGPWASIIEGILRNAGRIPGVRQEDVQMLLWGLIARTKVTALPPPVRAIAAQLLSPQDLTKVNGGALGLVPQRVRDLAQERLPDGVREIFEAESRVRQMLADGVSTYEEFEAVAVPDAGDARGQTPEVGADQWIATAQGFFVRFEPMGYQQVRVEVVVPRAAVGAGRADARRGPRVLAIGWMPGARQSAVAPLALDLPSILAMPANSFGQRLGLSSNPSPDGQPTDEDDWLSTQPPIAPIESGRQPVPDLGPPPPIDPLAPGGQPGPARGSPPPIGRITPAPRVQNPAAAPGLAGAPQLPPVIIVIAENVSVRDAAVPPLAPVIINVLERLSVRDAVIPPLPPVVININERVKIADQIDHE